MPDFIPITGLDGGGGNGGAVKLVNGQPAGNLFKVTMKGGWTAGHGAVHFVIRFYHADDEVDPTNQKGLGGNAGGNPIQYEIPELAVGDGHMGFTLVDQNSQYPRLKNVQGYAPIPDKDNPDYSYFWIVPPRSVPPIYVMVFVFDEEGYTHDPHGKNRRFTSASLYEDKSWGRIMLGAE